MRLHEDTRARGDHGCVCPPCRATHARVRPCRCFRRRPLGFGEPMAPIDSCAMLSYRPHFARARPGQAVDSIAGAQAEDVWLHRGRLRCLACRPGGPQSRRSRSRACPRPAGCHPTAWYPAGRLIARNLSASGKPNIPLATGVSGAERSGPKADLWMSYNSGGARSSSLRCESGRLSGLYPGSCSIFWKTDQ